MAENNPDLLKVLNTVGDNEIEIQDVEKIIKEINNSVIQGEENEIEIFRARCKLYWFSEGSWYVHAVGDLRVLKPGISAEDNAEDNAKNLVKNSEVKNSGEKNSEDKNAEEKNSEVERSAAESREDKNLELKNPETINQENKTQATENLEIETQEIKSVETKYQATKKYHRVIMRREDVLNLAINHHILPETNASQQQPKCIMWRCTDFSHPDDGDLGFNKTVMARFKTDEEASLFLKILQENTNTILKPQQNRVLE